MPDFSVRSDTVNVEQIMDQIRARIREKRGVDYTEQQIRDLAAVKLERFLDPKGLRSDLLDQFRKKQRENLPPAPPNYAFEDSTLYDSHRAPLRWIRRLLQPVLKLFFNPNPLIEALHIQSRVNTIHAERETVRQGLDELHFEVLHNLVVETTRLSIELKNLKMRVESLTSRLEFNERRARALESVVVYKPEEADSSRDRPGTTTTESEPGTAEAVAGPEGPGQRSRRRRRRRGRRGNAPAASMMRDGGNEGGQLESENARDAGNAATAAAAAQESADGNSASPSDSGSRDAPSDDFDDREP
jgi:hypothetical protein